MLAPALAAAAVLVLLPVLDTLWLSLHDVILYRPRSRPFTGLANYAHALGDPVFWESLGNSLVWVICAVSLQFTLGFATALLLNRSFAWRGIARALVVVPWAHADRKVEQRIRDELAKGTGIQKTAGIVGVGCGTVQRIKGAMAA
jgi:ABC-type sugar transport system permease subunit